MFFVTTNCLWATVTLAVKTLMFAAYVVAPVAENQALVGQVGARHAGPRSNIRGRRLRDLVLAGVRTNSVPSDNQHSVADSLDRLLHAAYRYFEFDVQEHNRSFYLAVQSCHVVAESTHEELSSALSVLAAFSQRSPSDIFILRFSLESPPELRASSGRRLLALLAACIGSRSVAATRTFESTVDEMLSTKRNVVVLVKDLSTLLPSNVSALRLPDMFVEDHAAVRNETDVSPWNVVERGGSLLEQHRSLNTLNVLVLNWQRPNASTTFSLLYEHSSLLPVVMMCAVACWAASRRCSMYKMYGGMAAASAVMTFLLALRMIMSSSGSPAVGNNHLLNHTCTAVVAAARYWVARPTRYRLNVLVVDYRKYCCGCACSTTPTSGVTGVAALANAGKIGRRVSLTHAGSPLSHAAGGLRVIFACPSVLFAYMVTSRDEGHVVAWNQLSDGDVVDFEEGEFPMDATVAVFVATVWNRWLHVSLSPIILTLLPHCSMPQLSADMHSYWPSLQGAVNRIELSVRLFVPFTPITPGRNVVKKIEVNGYIPHCTSN